MDDDDESRLQGIINNTIIIHLYTRQKTMYKRKKYKLGRDDNFTVVFIIIIIPLRFRRSESSSASASVGPVA